MDTSCRYISVKVEYIFFQTRLKKIASPTVIEMILLERPCSMTESNFVRGRKRDENNVGKKKGRGIKESYHFHGHVRGQMWLHSRGKKDFSSEGRLTLWNDESRNSCDPCGKGRNLVSWV